MSSGDCSSDKMLTNISNVLRAGAKRNVSKGSLRKVGIVKDKPGVTVRL